MRLTKVLILLISGFLSQSAIARDALLPDNRIVAYYGNFESSKMGVLGAYPPEEMLGMLHKELRKWAEADPETSVIPAIDYIAVVAQNHPGHDGKYRSRMPDDQIQKAIDIAKKVNGLVILDIQVGLSDVQSEIEHLAPYLASPHVMVALDPEFAMSDNTPPGKRIGSMDAKDINYAINFMAEIVRKNDLPPKILVVHRFTEHMVTNHKAIKPLPEVQVIMDMDGWGPQSQKTSSYRDFIAPESVQFTGIKLFYKEDLKKPSTGLLSPTQILKLKPTPLFILYQ